MGITAYLARALRGCAWFAASVGIWLFLGNRVVLHWSNSAVKIATMILLAVGLSWIVRAITARYHRVRWVLVPCVVVLGFAVGEVRRASLRHAYRGRAVLDAEPPAEKLGTPLTTTDLEVSRRVVITPNIGERLRVVHLTDLHFTPSLPWEYYQSIVERTNAEQPDVVILTGDYLSKIEHFPLLVRWLELPLSARSGVYAVLGNHDYWAGASDSVRQALERAKIHVLSGACSRLEPNTHPSVLLCGTERPWGEDFVDQAPSFGNLVLVLSHTPDNIYALRGRAHAVFSGHNHGGQWRVPGIGALIVPSVFGRRFDRGHFSVDGTDLFVSAGLGADFPPIRFYCPPELLVVDFVNRDRSEFSRVASNSREGRVKVEPPLYDIPH